MTNIHPSAIVHPKAQLGVDISIGPFCVVEGDVTIGDGCRLESRVTVRNGVTLGRNNEVGENTVLGGRAQHIANGPIGGRLTIGDNNRIRENCTFHTAFKPEDTTVVGNNNMMMCGVHVAHDCVIHSHTILVNNVLLGGHVTVYDRAFVSGDVAVHQFCRIGQQAMVGGKAKIVKDVPPFVTCDGVPAQVVGLNKIGLRRAGYTPAEIQQLKDAYRTIYRRGLRWNEVLQQLDAEFPQGPARKFLDFFAGGKRGFCTERRAPRSSAHTGAPTLRLHTGDSDGDIDARDAA